MEKAQYESFIKILSDELIPALGCTEPIAIAYGSAVASSLLGEDVESGVVEASGNIIKNVKGVVVPSSGGMKGIEAAAALGAIGGDPKLELEVLSSVTEEDIKRAKILMRNIQVRLLSSDCKLHLIITLKSKSHVATVEIAGSHTNIVRKELDGKTLFLKTYSEEKGSLSGYDELTVESIVDFAENVDLDRVAPILERQIELNSAIAKEGLSGNWGVSVGKNIVKYCGCGVNTMARAAAAAGSDARMSGCLSPVVINSGSGNQGITVTMPVVVYAEYLKASHERLLRALVISNLISIHQKQKIGRLSAYCGAVSASSGAGAAITWLKGGSLSMIKSTMVNTLANVSGIICDGAKPSCAAKIASALDAALMADMLTFEHETFSSGDGIVKDDIEATIDSVGEIARKGMESTDKTILEVMISKE